MSEEIKLPLRYYSPQSGATVGWVCGKDQNGQLTSVFFHSSGEKHIEYITEDKLKYIRDELIKDGWKETEPLKTTFTFKK
jgi:hypothetical protein